MAFFSRKSWRYTVDGSQLSVRFFNDGAGGRDEAEDCALFDNGKHRE